AVDIVKCERVAAAEIDHGIGADLGRNRKHITQRMYAGHASQVDVVDSAGPGHEAGDSIGAAADADDDGVVSTPATDRVGARAAVKGVVAGGAVERCVAPATVERASDRARDQRIVAAAADGGLDGRSRRNADIV